METVKRPMPASSWFGGGPIGRVKVVKILWVTLKLWARVTGQVSEPTERTTGRGNRQVNDGLRGIMMPMEGHQL